jgi:hypothetical protein
MVPPLGILEPPGEPSLRAQTTEGALVTGGRGGSGWGLARIGGSWADPHRTPGWMSG